MILDKYFKDFSSLRRGGRDLNSAKNIPLLLGGATLCLL